jgi:hypothetical protein
MHQEIAMQLTRIADALEKGLEQADVNDHYPPPGGAPPALMKALAENMLRTEDEKITGEIRGTACSDLVRAIGYLDDDMVPVEVFCDEDVWFRDVTHIQLEHIDGKLARLVIHVNGAKDTNR